MCKNQVTFKHRCSNRIFNQIFQKIIEKLPLWRLTHSDHDAGEATAQHAATSRTNPKDSIDQHIDSTNAVARQGPPFHGCI